MALGTWKSSVPSNSWCQLTPGGFIALGETVDVWHVLHEFHESGTARTEIDKAAYQGVGVWLAPQSSRSDGFLSPSFAKGPVANKNSWRTKWVVDCMFFSLRLRSYASIMETWNNLHSVSIYQQNDIQGIKAYLVKHCAWMCLSRLAILSLGVQDQSIALFSLNPSLLVESTSGAQSSIWPVFGPSIEAIVFSSRFSSHRSIGWSE